MEVLAAVSDTQAIEMFREELYQQEYVAKFEVFMNLVRRNCHNITSVNIVTDDFMRRRLVSSSSCRLRAKRTLLNQTISHHVVCYTLEPCNAASALSWPVHGYQSAKSLQSIITQELMACRDG